MLRHLAERGVWVDSNGFVHHMTRPEAQAAVYRWQFRGLPPATNNIYLSAGHRRVLTPEAREWRDAAVAVLISTSIGLTLPSEPLAIHIRLYPGNKRKWDVDGRQKLILDSLVESGLLDDDNYERVAFVGAHVMPVEKNAARTEIAVEMFNAWQQRVGAYPWQAA